MSARATTDVTLQINLSAGDLAYGAQMVASLVRTHRPDVSEVVIVADLCRPASARDFHAASRLPAREFATRVERLRGLCAALEADGTVDRTVFVTPNAASLAALNQRYAGVATPRSHDHFGHAFSAYFAGWDCARTRYVAHFDADILLWQAPGFSWVATALDALKNDETLLAVSPRIAPPPATNTLLDPQHALECWSASWPLHRHENGWISPWFSTRCHLIDRERLARVLPLGNPAHDRRAAAFDRWLRPLYDLRALTGSERSRIARRLLRCVPPFPLPPEVLLHEHAQRRDFSCLYLANPDAWFIHPDTKPERFVRLLPKLIEHVTVRGTHPPAQRGLSSVQFQAWENHDA
ncbi:MAG TPA: hypothetical protein VNR00_18665 [Opitutus sp.]|nr:hypothetical protein [Opitutus sp.]